MIYLALAALSVLFIELFVLLNVMVQTQRILTLSREATTTLGSKELPDSKKEVLIRKLSLQMLAATFALILRFVLIGVVLYGFYLGFASLFPEQREGFEASLYSPLIIVVMTIGAVAYVWFRRAIQKRL